MKKTSGLKWGAVIAASLGLLAMSTLAGIAYKYVGPATYGTNQWQDTVYSVPGGAEIDWDLNSTSPYGDTGIEIGGGGIDYIDSATNGQTKSGYTNTSYTDNITYYIYADAEYDTADIIISW